MIKFDRGSCLTVDVRPARQREKTHIRDLHEGVCALTKEIVLGD